jgi:hypothetical protein
VIGETEGRARETEENADTGETRGATWVTPRVSRDTYGPAAVYDRGVSAGPEPRV